MVRKFGKRVGVVALSVVAGVSFMSVTISKAVADEGPSVGGGTIKIDFNHVVERDTPKGKAAEFFKERAEALTSHRVVVNVYPNSKRFSDKEEMEALQMNVIQMAAPSFANFQPVGATAFEVFDLPYLFGSMDDVHKVTMGTAGRELFKSLETKELHGLAYWDNDFKQFSLNAPIHGPSSFIDKKIRIQNSEVINQQMLSIGALPIKLPFSEVAGALKSGSIDGAENPISNFYSKKMYESQKYLALTNHGYLGYAVITNSRFWNNLPGDVRAQLEQAMKETTEYANKIAAEKSKHDLEALKATGATTVIVPTNDEQEAMRSAMLPVHKKVAERIGFKNVQLVYNAIGFDPSKPLKKAIEPVVKETEQNAAPSSAVEKKKVSKKRKVAVIE